MNINEIVKEKDIALKAVSIIVYCGYLAGVVMLAIYAIYYFVAVGNLPQSYATAIVIAAVMLSQVAQYADPFNAILSKRIHIKKN